MYTWIYFKNILVIWSCLATLIHAVKEQKTGTMMVKEGDDVTLPCHIDTHVNVDNATVEWTRLDPMPQYVYLLQDGLVVRDHLNPLYKDRTAVSAEEISRGNLSMKLSRVRLSDEGTYKCNAPNLSNGARIQLNVGKVSKPAIFSTGAEDDASYLVCDSGCWYPQPRISWLYTEGHFLPDKVSQIERDPESTHCYVLQWTLKVIQAGTTVCKLHLPHINYTLATRTQVPEPILRLKVKATTSSHLLDVRSTLNTHTSTEHGAKSKAKASITDQLPRINYTSEAHTVIPQENEYVSGHPPEVNYTLDVWTVIPGGGPMTGIMRAQFGLIAITVMLLGLLLGFLNWMKRKKTEQRQHSEIIYHETML